jgi:hypothetical protein
VTIAARETHQFVLPEAKARRRRPGTVSSSCPRLVGHTQRTVIDGDRPRSDIVDVELPRAHGVGEPWLTAAARKRFEAGTRVSNRHMSQP